MTALLIVAAVLVDLAIGILIGKTIAQRDKRAPHPNPSPHPIFDATAEELDFTDDGADTASPSFRGHTADALALGPDPVFTRKLRLAVIDEIAELRRGVERMSR